MARPLRLEFSGAVYHVTSRGNARQDIVVDDGGLSNNYQMPTAGPERRVFTIPNRGFGRALSGIYGRLCELGSIFELMSVDIGALAQSPSGLYSPTSPCPAAAGFLSL